MSLVTGAPFNTKTECAKVLGINRSSVAAYLDADKLFKNRWILSSTVLSKQEISKWVIPSEVWEIITPQARELLGDGHIRYDPIKAPQVNGRLEFTFSAKILHYVKYLKNDVLATICIESEPTPWPNPNLTGVEPTQYWFSTKRLSTISDLHSVWYKEIKGKYVKRLPLNIADLLTPQPSFLVSGAVLGAKHLVSNNLYLRPASNPRYKDKSYPYVSLRFTHSITGNP